MQLDGCPSKRRRSTRNTVPHHDGFYRLGRRRLVTYVELGVLLEHLLGQLRVLLVEKLEDWLEMLVFRHPADG